MNAQHQPPRRNALQEENQTFVGLQAKWKGVLAVLPLDLREPLRMAPTQELLDEVEGREEHDHGRQHGGEEQDEGIHWWTKVLTNIGTGMVHHL